MQQDPNPPNESGYVPAVSCHAMLEASHSHVDNHTSRVMLLVQAMALLGH